MKTLIVEDDFASRVLLQSILQAYGECNIAVNGREAINAVQMAIAAKTPYNLICMDIMMPEMDGQEALKEIRRIEQSAGIYGNDGVKIVMVTGLGDTRNIMTAFREQCDIYIKKPIETEKLIHELKALNLIT
jgi:two-component system, chemotaxis family, chemotaxis protein CheY